MTAWRASGLSQADYCREQNLAIGNFSRWKRKLAQDGQPNTRKFVEIPRNMQLTDRAALLVDSNKVTISVKNDEITITVAR